MKKIVSVVLGMFFLTTPLAGCDSDKGNTSAKICFSENEWVFERGEDEKTILDLASIEAVVVETNFAYPQEDASPLYLYKDDVDKIQTLYDGILGESLTLQKTDEMKDGSITLTAYDKYGAKETAWITSEGRFLCRSGNEYYLSETGVADVEEIAEYCTDWQRDYFYLLRQTETHLVFSNDSQDASASIALESISFGDMGRGADSVKASINAPFKKEMVLAALRLTDGQRFRKTTVVPITVNAIEFAIVCQGTAYTISVREEGAIALRLEDSNEYYITEHGVVNYALFVQLCSEWR